jgi:hypothetical protein
MKPIKSVYYKNNIDYIKVSDLFTYRISFTFYILLIFFTILITILLLINLDLLINNYHFLEIENNLNFHGVKINDQYYFDRNSSYQSLLFDRFIDLFDKNNSSNKYFPSYFIKDSYSLTICHNTNNNTIIINKTPFTETMNYKDKYLMAEYENSGFRCLMVDIYNIIKDF